MRLNITALLLAMLVAGYQRPVPILVKGYTYAVAHTDAQYVYIARRLDGGGFKLGIDYGCNAMAGLNCVVYSLDSLPANKRIPVDRVRRLSEGEYVEYQVTR